MNSSLFNKKYDEVTVAARVTVGGCSCRLPVWPTHTLAMSEMSESRAQHV